MCNDPNKVQVDWTKVDKTKLGTTSKKEESYRLLIDVKEFQQKVLDYMCSNEIDTMIEHTDFKDKPECKNAIIHGMAVASLLTSTCESFYVKDKSN